MKKNTNFFNSYHISNYLYLIITLLKQEIVAKVIVLTEKLTANSQLMDKNVFMYNKLHAKLFCVWFYTTRVTNKIKICVMIIWSDLWSVMKMSDGDGDVCNTRSNTNTLPALTLSLPKSFGYLIQKWSTTLLENDNIYLWCKFLVKR